MCVHFEVIAKEVEGMIQRDGVIYARRYPRIPPRYPWKDGGGGEFVIIPRIEH